MEDKQSELISAEMTAQDERVLGGTFYGRTAVDEKEHKRDLRDIAAAGYVPCEDCGAWGFCETCHDNGYLDADGRPFTWGHWGTLPRTGEVGRCLVSDS